MIVGLLLASTSLASVSGERGYVAVAVELEGPLERVLLRGALPVATEIRLSVPDGGRRRILVPMGDGPTLPAGPSSRPRVELIEPAGSAGSTEGRVRIDELPDASWERAWTDLPLGLRLRSRPPVSSSVPATGPVPIALLLATFLACAGWRRRAPRAALASVALGSALALSLPLGLRSSAGDEVARVVIEGTAGEDVWLRVWGGVGEVSFALDPGRPEDLPLRVESESDQALLRWSVQEGARGRLFWSAHSAGTSLHVVQRYSPSGLLQPLNNDLADLDATWLRTPAGAWRAGGPWRRGQAAPLDLSGNPESADQATSAPPGWLASGLPQGVSILLARLTSEPGQPETWLRLVGF